MAEKDQSKEFQNLLRDFQGLANDFFNAEEVDQKQREALVAVLRANYQSFGREAKAATGMGCPPPWETCEDGSCARPGSC